MRRIKRAFTLLETLTALGVFCFAVLGLLFALHMTADAANSVQKEKQIREQLESRLARLSLPPFQESSIKVSESGVMYTEEVQKQEVQTKDNPRLPGYWKIRVIADWNEGKNRQNWDASHLLWNP